MTLRNECAERESRLNEVAPDLDALLCGGGEPPPIYSVADIAVRREMVPMRDGTRLATDVYLPPTSRAPMLVTRTPYGRGNDRNAAAFLSFARRGYAVAAQDCRGTGESEPESWDYYMYEAEDGPDFIEWLIRQSWYDGFIGSCGGSYSGQTQWCMALHTKMSTIVPEVSGLGVAANTAHVHMLINAYARSVGKGVGKVAIHYSELERLIHEETLSGGWFNNPLGLPFRDRLERLVPEIEGLSDIHARQRLWQHYCKLSGRQRAEFVSRALEVDSITVVEVEALSDIFGARISHDAHTIPGLDPSATARLLRAPPLMITGWYDWGLNDALATWSLLQRNATDAVRNGSRLILTPAAHNVPGYHEGMAERLDLKSNHRTVNQVGLLLKWYEAVRQDTIEQWPKVIFYLMGANEWRTASSWPPGGASTLSLYLSESGLLKRAAPREQRAFDSYAYDPTDPTPTVGGSIISSIYPPGSVDVSIVQRRSDVITFTTPPLERALDVAGPIRLVLYVSSTAPDTDFVGRLSDVFPDGRALQLQNGVLRTRYRALDEEPSLLEPGSVYRLEIDMWATANRFKAGHCIRLDISSADFPRFDRNANRGGERGPSRPARQTIWRDCERPSHLQLSVIGQSSCVPPQ